MREIKFRIWDTEQKMMKLPLDIRRNFYSNFIMWDDTILMQYTGLKDKNGKEIYEGDIMIFNESDDEWYDVVEWREKEARFEFKRFVKESTDCSFKSYANKERIIGNIYENPELLEGDTK